MYPVDVIVTLLRIAYEHSCPFLTIKSPYNRKNESVRLMDYVKQFWGSRKKNKATAQSLVSASGLLNVIRARLDEIQESSVQAAIRELATMSALCRVIVDVDGDEVEKLLLSPLGFQLWKRIDKGPLFNQEQISSQDLQQLLTRDLLVEVLQLENKAWLNLHQSGLKPQPKGPFTREMVCFGWYLLFNEAIAKDRAFHLIRTSNKDYEWDKTLVQGLNVVANNLFDNDTLFKLPSIQDVLQRRSELIRGVGSIFEFLKLPGDTEEYFFWWEIGDYTHDSSRLDRVVRILVDRALHWSEDGEKQPLVEELKALFAFFRYGVDNQLSRFQVSKLFPKQITRNFDYALQASINQMLTEIVATKEEIQ